MELILVRHGITPGNLEHRFVGRLDQPLAPEGEALAREVAPTLPPVEHIYRSPLLRCRQTADILWPGVAQTVVDDLKETDFGPYEGKCHAELDGDPVYQRWLNGELEIGEPIENCNRGQRRPSGRSPPTWPPRGIRRRAWWPRGHLYEHALPVRPAGAVLLRLDAAQLQRLPGSAGPTDPLALRVFAAVGRAKL